MAAVRRSARIADRHKLDASLVNKKPDRLLFSDIVLPSQSKYKCFGLLNKQDLKEPEIEFVGSIITLPYCRCNPRVRAYQAVLVLYG